MSGFSPFGPQPSIMSTTALAGYTLVNGTGNVVTSWAVPADGALHRVLMVASLDVSSAETGGQLQLAATMPDGTAFTFNFFGTQGGGGHGTTQAIHVKAGTTVTVTQTTALTAGAATAWVDLWGA